MRAHPDAPLKHRSILLVEDELFIAMAIEEYLRAAGADVVESAATLGEAWGRLDARVYDAAILDIRLPDGAPNELAAHLLKQDTAVIFHSGHADASLTREFPSAQFCSKPSPPDVIIDTVRRSLA